MTISLIILQNNYAEHHYKFSHKKLGQKNYLNDCNIKKDLCIIIQSLHKLQGIKLVLITYMI